MKIDATSSSNDNNSKKREDLTSLGSDDSGTNKKCENYFICLIVFGWKDKLKTANLLHLAKNLKVLFAE